MEPRIQYAKTRDGVSIAFWTMGEGMPLVLTPLAMFSHLEMEWRIPEVRSWYERLAAKRMLIRYDTRGMGLSKRDVADGSLGAHLLDLEAVVDRLDLRRFVLFGLMHNGPLAMAYVADHPQRVSNLILWCSWATASEYYRSPAVQSLGSLRDQDWQTYTETIAQALTGWSGALARQVAEIFREAISQEQLLAYVREAAQWDAAPLLPSILSPTLVLHRRQLRFVPVELARELASQISDARLVLLEGESGVPFSGDMEAVASAIDEFLGAGQETETGDGGLPAEIVHTILFTDVEGSTALTQRLGDAKARELLREHERMVREALKAHGGSEVKTMGDGFMTSFSSATKALECAIAMQRAFAEHNESAQEPIMVRVGLNAGEPIAEDDPDGRSDLFGTAVNRAARITAAAKGGEILVANVVRELAEGKDFLFADRGEASLKGFDEPVRLYELRWREAG